MVDSLLDPIQVTARVTQVLERYQVPYFIGGSLASTLYGQVRMTQDSDLIARMEPEVLPAFVRDLQEDFYVDPEMIADAIEHRSSFNLIHRLSMFKVDIFIPGDRAYTHQQFARARRVALSIDPLVEAMVASAEDTLLAKLEWYRLGGEVSERQWRDVLGILKVQSSALDREYLGEAAVKLGVKDLLDRAVQQTTLPPPAVGAG